MSDEIDGKISGLTLAVKEFLVQAFEDIGRVLDGKKTQKNGRIIKAAAAAFEPLQKRLCTLEDFSETISGRIDELNRQIAALDARIAAASINNRRLQ
jgi:hypothetical protein